MVYNVQVGRAATLITELYRLAPTGGPLHVVVDDWNIEDGDLQVRQAYRADRSPWYSAEVMHRAEMIAGLMRAMSQDERLSTLAHQEGFLADGRPTAVGVSYLEAHRLHLGEVEPEDRPCRCLPTSAHG